MSRFIDRLRLGECRWIIGFGERAIVSGGAACRLARCCGAPQQEGRSYCAEHVARSIVPGTARRMTPPAERSIQRATPAREKVSTLCEMIG